MALTLKVEQKLDDTGLIALFEEHEAVWTGLAEKCHAFVCENFPDGSLIRKDDVAENLVPVLEVHDTLRAYVLENKLRQKYWIRYFGDLILDRVWDDLG